MSVPCLCVCLFVCLLFGLQGGGVWAGPPSRVSQTGSALRTGCQQERCVYRVRDDCGLMYSGA